ncbi:helix-turn-helix domain-containing protein [Leptospira santarosai]|uniref:helix-turn-helix domain-containing protein n=1 Tax=Leptospira santarosai TaxID=28183 RepID=UPI0024AF087A|nr:helix-turn-helix transcriptional regulator [Leptospira santarosai]MDI7165923.1 helix-turn-helix transcriptional regulator [Leptospira santarosai]
MITRLRKVFEESGLNQSDFAESIGLKPSSFSDLLYGRAKNPSVETVSNLIKTYNVNPLWLMTGEGPEKNPRHAPSPLSEEKIREMDLHDRRVRKMTTTPGATEMLDDYLTLDERDRTTVNLLVKQLKK